MTKQEKLEKFIIDNDLKFDDDGSGLNSECCIISGYALFINANVNIIVDAINDENSATGFLDELERVFNYAESNGYDAFWRTSQAKKEYKF